MNKKQIYGMVLVCGGLALMMGQQTSHYSCENCTKREEKETVEVNYSPVAILTDITVRGATASVSASASASPSPEATD